MMDPGVMGSILVVGMVTDNSRWHGKFPCLQSYWHRTHSPHPSNCHSSCHWESARWTLEQAGPLVTRDQEEWHPWEATHWIRADVGLQTFQVLGPERLHVTIFLLFPNLLLFVFSRRVHILFRICRYNYISLLLIIHPFHSHMFILWTPHAVLPYYQKGIFHVFVPLSPHTLSPPLGSLVPST